jgi:hypothetical protein
LGDDARKALGLNMFCFKELKDLRKVNKYIVDSFAPKSLFCAIEVIFVQKLLLNNFAVQVKFAQLGFG